MDLQNKFISGPAAVLKRTFLFLVLLQGQVSGFSQSTSPAEAISHAMEEKDKFIEYVRYVSADTMLLTNLPTFFESEAEAICRFIVDTASVQDTEQVKAIRSFQYFMRELTRRITFWRYELYDIAGALKSYKDFLKPLLLHGSYTDVLKPLNPVRAQILANTFWQYNECDLIEDIASYKRLATDPELILEYLDIVPGYRFADSLLLVAAALKPVSLINTLPENMPGLHHLMSNSHNKYVQQLTILWKNHLASELLPFLVP